MYMASRPTLTLLWESSWTPIWAVIQPIKGYSKLAAPFNLTQKKKLSEWVHPELKRPALARLPSPWAQPSNTQISTLSSTDFWAPALM
ncbi:hypothetical protein DSO57_1004856 [Entomophthora muscae]|uniref:Uncharacterized protein n=1 Tax=Entomophthora muscae TaxID=34485 RepID=A0ACC2RZ59_9FUNG|nr:hypothetical protein DSO57_1004856 [Entomophthora muscae]